MEGKFHWSIAKPKMMYGLKYWTISKKKELKMKVIMMRVWYDKIG